MPDENIFLPRDRSPLITLLLNYVSINDKRMQCNFILTSDAIKSYYITDTASRINAQLILTASPVLPKKIASEPRKLFAVLMKKLMRCTGLS